MAFVAPAGGALAPRARPRLSARRARAACARRPRAVRAVFLPREPGPPLEPEGDEHDAAGGASPAPGGGAAAAPGGAGDAPGNGARTAYRPREDSVDRVLEGAPVERELDTWAARNEGRAVTALRGRSAHSIGADELNESLRPSYLQRHRLVLAPDEAFGAIFAWDAVVANSRELELRAWAAVARERGLPPPDLDDVVRAEDMPAEKAVERVFFWTRDWGEIKDIVHRKAELYEQLVADYPFRASRGLGGWLALLARYGVKCVLCASRPRERVHQVVQGLGLDPFFKKNEIVAAEDEFDTLEQMFLFAAIKAERPPQKCVIFTDRPTGIAAGHEVSSKVVALIGAHPAYEVKTADETIASYDSLVVYNIRRLFSEAGMELMDPQTELERGR